MYGRPVAIAGVHATAQGLTLPGRTSLDLTQEAVFGALDDAGLSAADVDGVQLDWPGPGGAPGDAGSWATVLGRPLTWLVDGMLGNAGVRGVAQAGAAIAAGLCDTVVIGGGQAGAFGPGVIGAGQVLEFGDLWGASVMPHFAMVAQRHMHEFGTTSEQLAAVAVTIRNNASTNPEAAMAGRGPYTVQDVLSSRMIASPLHLLDCCIRGEGGAAIVLTTLERARDLPGEPVRLVHAAMDVVGPAYAAPALYRDVGDLGARAAGRVLDAAGAGIEDVDVFSLYDPTSFEVIRQLEALGVCRAGEGGPLVESGAIAVGGAHPVNPDGGCLGHSWTGTQQMTIRVIEAVRQLRGTAVHQVAGAELALVANAGSGAKHYELCLLGTS